MKLRSHKECFIILLNFIVNLQYLIRDRDLINYFIK